MMRLVPPSSAGTSNTRFLSSSIGYSVSVSSRLDSSGLIIAKIPPSRRNHNDTILVGNGDARTGRILTNISLLRAGPSEPVAGPFACLLYTSTYIPIALIALVKKAAWKPIRHSISVDVAEFSEAEGVRLSSK